MDCYASYTEAKSLASITVDYIANNGADSLFTSYFGNTSVRIKSLLEQRRWLISVL